MLVVDAQVHLFGPDQQGRAAAVQQRVISAGDVVDMMDAAGVDRAYLVPAGFAANDTCVEASRTWPDRFRVMGIVPLAEAEVGREMVRDWASTGMSGARLRFPPFRDPSWLDDGTADWFWPAAEVADIPVMVWAPGRLSDLATVAADHPRLRMVVDHLGLYVEDRDEKVLAVVEELVQLAEFGNIAVKASGLAEHTSERYPFRNLHAPVRAVVEAFGAERVFWGSDLTRMNCGYDPLITLFTEEMGLPEAQIAQIMGAAVTAWIGW